MKKCFLSHLPQSPFSASSSRWRTCVTLTLFQRRRTADEHRRRRTAASHDGYKGCLWVHNFASLRRKFKVTRKCKFELPLKKKIDSIMGWRITVSILPLKSLFMTLDLRGFPCTTCRWNLHQLLLLLHPHKVLKNWFLVAIFKKYAKIWPPPPLEKRLLTMT